MIFDYMLAALIGLAGGVAVGTGFVAFITVLDIIPRLMQMIKGITYILWFQRAIILGAFFFTWIDFRGYVIKLPTAIHVIIGTLAGIFIGLLAAALTEVVNVLPILAKRLNMANAILFLLVAMIFGKITGSLFHFIFYIE